MIYIGCAILLLVSFVEGATITCPTLKCSVVLDTNVCFLHDSVQPTLTIKGASCSNTRICEFSTTNDKFAWYSEATQSDSSGASSFIQDKEVKGLCVEIDATKQQLNAGRDGEEDYQCHSGTGSESQCSGLGEGEYCSIDADGGENMYCKTESKWPFRAQGNDLLGSMEIGATDSQCGYKYFGWYASDAEKTSGIQRCIEKYSSEDEQMFGWDTAPSESILSDNEYNGQFCESGFAVQDGSVTDRAICKSVTEITYGGSTLTSPYPCDPTDNSAKCSLVYGTGGSDSVDIDGVCALDGTNGYCESVAGTEVYRQYTQAMKNVLEEIKGHTLDRNNLRAYKEGGGIGTSDNKWYFAMDKRFNVTYWPWIQETTSRNCIEAIFEDSYTNLSKDSAMFMKWTISIILVAIVLVI